MENDAQRKNWGEDSREERHPDWEPAAPLDPIGPNVGNEGNEGNAGNDRKDPVDEESEESFPASDPPAFTPGKLA
jgi:hypothetical protein